MTLGDVPSKTKFLSATGGLQENRGKLPAIRGGRWGEIPEGAAMLEGLKVT